MEGEPQVEPIMASHGYNHDDGIGSADADGWNQHEPRATRRAPQQGQIHRTQRMTTKAVPAHDGGTGFLAFEDAIHDWRDFTELEPERRGPSLRNRLEGGAAQRTAVRQRPLERSHRRSALFQKIAATPFHEGSPKQCSCTDLRSS